MFIVSHGLTVAVYGGYEEEQKKNATAAGQWAQYDERTGEGRTVCP